MKLWLQTSNSQGTRAIIYWCGNSAMGLDIILICEYTLTLYVQAFHSVFDIQEHYTKDLIFTFYHWFMISGGRYYLSIIVYGWYVCLHSSFLYNSLAISPLLGKVLLPLYSYDWSSIKFQEILALLSLLTMHYAMLSIFLALGAYHEASYFLW